MFLGVVQDYLRDEGHVFADSGAFGAFRKGIRLDVADFLRVLSVYRALTAHAQPGHLRIVAPDVVGDQDATLDLLRYFASDIRDLHERGAVVLVPLQRGRLTISEMHAEVVGILGFCFCSALPTNAAALPSDEVLTFLQRSRPLSVHFLGAARSARFQLLLQDACSVHPDCAYSFDAAVVRQVIDELVRNPDRIRDAALIGLSDGEYDEGEMAEAIRVGDDLALSALAVVTKLDVRQIRARGLECHEGDFLAAAEDLFPYLDQCWALISAQIAQKLCSSEWRTRQLSRTPVFADDPHSHAQQSLMPGMFGDN
jgi:hypothetical protein